MSELQSAPLAENEVERLKALRSYQIMDTEREAIFDELASLISYICKVPMALITFMDKDRQWHKSKIGIHELERSRTESFCQYAILEKGILEISDIDKDPNFKKASSIYGALPIKFYAGTSINTSEGHAIGTICVMDNTPRKLTLEQKNCLKTIAKQVMTQLELRRINLNLKNELEELLEEKIHDTRDRLMQKEAEANYIKQSLDMSNATISLDLQANIIHVNDHFCELTGYHADELIGKPNRILFDDEAGLATNFDALWKKLKEGKYHNGLFKILTKDKKTKWFFSNYNPIKDNEGRLTSILNIVQDVTNEEKYKSALEKAKITAEQAVVAKDNFLSNMSHEIRTPLNAILGFTDILKNEKLSSAQLDHVNTISKAGDNLLNLINDILDLSKIESGKFKLERVNFDVAAVFENAQKIFFPKAKNKGIRLLTSFKSEKPFWVKGDEHRLNQILFNLINNAIKFTKKGKVEVIAEMKQKTRKKYILQCSVIDTGIGIAPEKQKYIFERFTQADSDTTRKFGGTGLGLNIVKLLTNNFKGNISLESTVDAGTKLMLSIPFKLGERPDEVPINEVPKDHANKEIVILMLEDNPLNQKLGKHLIQDFGYTLAIVNNGREGIEWLQNNRADLILMDLQMPELDGYEATDYIRNKLQLKIPIIAMTAHSLGSERDKCIAIGMNDFITKPFKAENLRLLIEKWIALKEEDHSDLSEKLYDLTSLRNLSNNNQQFIDEMTEVFVRETPKELVLIDIALRQKNYTEVAEIAHKLKSSYNLIGFSQMHIIKSLESLSEAPNNAQEIQQIAHELKRLSRQLIDELIASQ